MSNLERSFIWTRMLPGPLVTGLATLGPVGSRLPAPGTMGSIAGLVWYTLVFHHLDPIGFILLFLISCYFAAAICGEAEIRMAKRDPGEVILDEFVAVPLCFFGLQGAIAQMGSWAWVILVAGFGLFRLFDILKPLGIDRLQNLPGGIGVLMDDVAAALATCLCLHVFWYLGV